MIILAIDTSCDETSVAVTEGFSIRSNIISSQVKQHAEFGGVVPMLAARLHEEKIDEVIRLALEVAGVTEKDIEAIAVTYGSGLAPALQVGIAKAKELAKAWNIPFYGINHMHGHLVSMLADDVPVEAPVLGLLVSGGHTELVYTEDWHEITLLGQTLDDAVGEAFDKVAKLLGLGYPGGRILSDWADKGKVVYELPVPMKGSGDLNFSYSGLKNAVRLLVEREKAEAGELTDEQIANIAASFRAAAFGHLTNKVEKALKLHPEVASLVLGGGVAASVFLRGLLEKMASNYGVTFVYPKDFALCTDNAAMIGLSAHVELQHGLHPAGDTLDRKPGLTW